MKGLIILLLIVILSGCGKVKMTKTGEDITWESTTWFKDLDAVEAGSDGFDFNMGSSKSAMTQEQAQALACLRNPEACK